MHWCIKIAYAHGTLHTGLTTRPGSHVVVALWPLRHEGAVMRDVTCGGQPEPLAVEAELCAGEIDL